MLALPPSLLRCARPMRRMASACSSLSVGLCTRRGLQVSFRALPRILAEYPDVKLLVAGKNGSSYQPLAYELNVDRAVVFLDFISNHERDCLYRIADAAIFPSLYEPFGIVALEAMAAGLQRHCLQRRRSGGGRAPSPQWPDGYPGQPNEHRLGGAAVVHRS